jgi:pro-kumamolisin-like protein/Big-like domain-containing protein
MNSVIKTNLTKMLSSRSLSLCVLASAIFCSAVSMAQAPAPAVRIVSPIDEGRLVSLSGNVNPLANIQNDRGPVSGDLPMTGLTLVLNRGLEQQAAFDAYVAGEYDPSSPNFHQWLTPQQIGAQFGPAPADIAAITGWLTSQGFAVKSVSPDGMSINFSGTAAQAQAAFHTEIHNLLVNGKTQIANMSDPQIPAALAPVVNGVKGLHNFLPHPLHRIGSKVQFNPDAHGWLKLQPLAAPGQQSSTGAGFNRGGPATSTNSTSSPQPNFYYPITSGGATVAVEEDVAPYDFATMYNLTPLWTSSITGSGQTISIIGTSDIDLTDVSSFKTAFGLPAGLTPVIAHGPDGDPGICTGGTNVCNSGDLDENSLDVEWSGAVATGAQIVLVTDAYNNETNPTNDPIYDGAQWVINNASVSGTAVYGSHIISLSYGECELFNGTASNVAYNNLWQTAAAAGIAVFASTGDSGSASCDQGQDGIGNPYEAQFGLSVSGLASTPYDTAVGGTDFTWCQPSYNSSGIYQGCSSSNATPYWNTSNSTTTQASAKGYVPEKPWNDTCEDPTWAKFLESIATLVGAGSVSTPEEACNFVYNDALELYFDFGDPMLAGFVDTVGGSGGASNCVVNSTTYATLGSCGAGDTSTGSSYDSLTLFNNGWPKPSWQTSAASLGVPADGVRDLPDVSFFAGDGSLESATLICVSNDGASCTNVSVTGSVYNGTSNSNGGAEEVGGTSVATPEMAGVMALINQKAGGAQGSPNAELYTLAGKQTYSSCSAEKGSASSACYFNDIDTGTNAQPCAPTTTVLEGGAEYAGNGNWIASTAVGANASPNCTIVNAGDVVGTLSGYSAATGYDQASGLGSLNIANVVNGWTAASGVSTGSNTAAVAISLNGVTSITVSQSLTVSVTVSGHLATPTGSVILQTNENDYNSTKTLSGGTTTFTIPANTFTSAGTVTLTVTYSGDSNYAAAGTSTTFTVSQPPDFGLGNSGAISVTAGATTGNTTTFDVVPLGGFTGSVNLTCALAPLNGGVAAPTCTVGSPAVITSAQSVNETVTVTSSTSTTPGLYNLTVTGTSGADDVHTSEIGLTIASTTATYSVSAATPAAISPGSSTTSTITVQGSGGYTGSVTLTCALNSGGPTNQSGDAPSCSVTSGSPVNLTVGTPTGHATATVTTTAAVADLIYPKVGKGKGWLGAGSGAVLAVLIFFGIPARRRSWRSMLGILVAMAVIGTLSSCGAVSNSGGGGGGGNPGTTAGTYTFTLTATGNPAVTPAPTTTFTVTVN